MRYDGFREAPLGRASNHYRARWATLHYARNHATLQRDFSESLNFFSDQLENVAIAETRKSRTLETFLADPGQPNIDIEIRAVALEDLRQPPYRAHIEFQKVFRPPRAPQDLRREPRPPTYVHRLHN